MSDLLMLDGVSVGRVVEACAGATCLAFLHGAIAFAAGAARGHRSAGIATATGVAVAGYLLHGPTPGWLSELGDLAGFLRHVLVGPLVTIALTLVYYDLRVRKEGFDLQLMVAALGDAGSAPPAAPGSAVRP